MNIREKFNDSDLQGIKDAVANAEFKISGEIVPVIVERSGQYVIANYKGSLLGACLAFIAMILIDRYILADTGNTLYYDPVFIFFAVVAGGLIGALIPNISEPIKRLLISQSSLDGATRQRAENVFLEEEVFNTRQRTGIMIFISFFEHKVIVMADKGINELVDQKHWDKIVSDLVLSIRNGRTSEGLKDCIARCGEILFENGFVKTPDDINELRDDLRID